MARYKDYFKILEEKEKRDNKKEFGDFE